MTTSSSNIKSCRFYCTECFAETEFECTCVDATGLPFVDLIENEETYLHNKSVSGIRSEETPVSPHDINFLRDLGDSKTGEVTRYELSQMYDVRYTTG